MKFSSRWLEKVRDEEDLEVGVHSEDDEEKEDDVFDRLLPDWAKSAVDSFDNQMFQAEEQLFASVAALAPWMKRRSENVQQSAQATLEASRRFRWFVFWLLVAFFFFFLAVFVGLPVLVLRPQKFALCFTLGSIFFMTSFAALRGTKAHLQMLFETRRIPFTFAYFFTMALTLYASVVQRSFIFTVLWSLTQFTTLLYYLGSFIPGGSKGVRFFLAALSRTFRLTVKPLVATCVRCCMRYCVQ
mmetsp:Transcript_9693/g.13459  ORF Transcript_9693/g.13459 Transcript_9693/m.13459 type:complete len:243 (-) Transcript_9693:629-1357(-)